MQEPHENKAMFRSPPSWTPERTLTFRVDAPTLADIEHVVSDVRESDHEAVERMTGSTDFKATLLLELQRSSAFFCAYVNDTPAALFGVVPSFEDQANIDTPWAVATRYAAWHSLTFARRSREMLDLLQTEFNGLLTFIDAEDERSIRWHEFSGFKIKGLMPLGNEKRPFLVAVRWRVVK